MSVRVQTPGELHTRRKMVRIASRSLLPYKMVKCTMSVRAAKLSRNHVLASREWGTELYQMPFEGRGNRYYYAVSPSRVNFDNVSYVVKIASEHDVCLVNPV